MDEFCNPDKKCKPSVSPGDQCGTNHDCQLKDKGKSVCKIVGGVRKCVRPEECKAQCSNHQICNAYDKCISPGKGTILLIGGKSI